MRLALLIQCSRCTNSWSQLARYPVTLCSCTLSAGKRLTTVEPFVAL